MTELTQNEALARDAEFVTSLLSEFVVEDEGTHIIFVTLDPNNQGGKFQHRHWSRSDEATLLLSTFRMRAGMEHQLTDSCAVRDVNKTAVVMDGGSIFLRRAVDMIANIPRGCKIFFLHDSSVYTLDSAPGETQLIQHLHHTGVRLVSVSRRNQITVMQQAIESLLRME